MNENINFTIKDGKTTYQTASSNNLKMPSMVFDRLEDAELAVLIAKVMQVRGNTNFDAILSGVKYTFRILGLNDSPWVE